MNNRYKHFIGYYDNTHKLIKAGDVGTFHGLITLYISTLWCYWCSLRVRVTLFITETSSKANQLAYK